MPIYIPKIKVFGDSKP